MGALHALFFLCSPVLLDTRAPLPPHLPEGTIKASRTSPVVLGMTWRVCYSVHMCSYMRMIVVHHLSRLHGRRRRPPWLLQLPPMNHVIRARQSSIMPLQTIWRPCSPRSTPILTPQVYRLMSNANFTTTCSAVSSRTAFCDWDVTPATKSYYCPSAASGEG